MSVYRLYDVNQTLVFRKRSEKEMKKASKIVRKSTIFIFPLCLVIIIILLALGYQAKTGPLIIAFFASMALYFMSHPFLKSFAFTIWVFAFVAASMVYPTAFGTWFRLDLKILIVPLIQIIMFGMGTTLCLADFGRVFKMPWPILVGFVLQFSVMPLTGYALTKVFNFEKEKTTIEIASDVNLATDEIATDINLAADANSANDETLLADKTSGDEIAAGVVLIGSCPGGVASNLMTFLAGGNVALSVTMTSCSTLVSPLMTPFLMQKLAGEYIEINFLEMMFGIINMIIVPIVAGLIANRVLYSQQKLYHSAFALAVIGMACIIIGFGMAFFAPAAVYNYYPKPDEQDSADEEMIEDSNASEAGLEPNLAAIEDPNISETAKAEVKPIPLKKDGFVVGFLLIGVVALSKLIISVLLKGPENWMDKALPIVSMVGICYIIAIITARSRDDLMAVGPILICAAIIHNFIGYILGYWFARAARLDESSCRTVAFEVGMQNGGMASGLAMNVLKSAPAALAPAIFGPWMNVSGSVLATWWHRKPVSAKKIENEGGKNEQT
jgi:BASS family bile acid:Na+ symporter